MEEELKDLKSVLRSIVVSCPVSVDVRTLLRDYKNMVGAPIPLAKYGYRDPLAFLKERCADCFLFSGTPSNPFLTLIVPDSLKHIDAFVQKQKISSVLKSKGKRRSVPEPALRRASEYSREQEKPHDLIFKTFKRNVEHTQTENNVKSILCTNNNNNISTVNINKPEDKPPDKIHEIKNITQRMADINIDKNHSNNNNNMTTCTKSTIDIKCDKNGSNSQISDSPSVNVHNFLRKRLPMYNSSQYLDSEVCSDKVSSKDDTDSGRQTASSHSGRKRAQMEVLKDEIYEIIREHEEGVALADLTRLYRERYGRELEPGRGSLNGVLGDMAARVAVSVLPAGVRLHDAARSPAPPAPAAPRAPAPGPAPRAAPRPAPRAPPVDVDDALPGVDFDPDVFPEDCVHFMESIPALGLGDVRAGAMLEVIVGEVYSPSHFWLIRLGERYDLAMEETMDEMTEYYSRGEGRHRVLARGAVRVGHYCTSLYEGDWHRSLIVKILDGDTVKVRQVDYGTVETARAGELKPLLRRWAALPAQAVRARLAGLRPGAGGRRWLHAAAAHFLHLVRDARLVANVVALDPHEDTLEVFLIDTRAAHDVCVTREMIRAGHADPRADSALRTDECYLYPRFAALEAGDTPNFAEIDRYLGDGISLEFVEAYRRHVPSALPPPLHPPAPPPPPATPPPVELVNRVPLLLCPSEPEPAPASAPPPLRSPPAPASAPPPPPAPAPPPPRPPPCAMNPPPPPPAQYNAPPVWYAPCPPGCTGAPQLTVSEWEMYSMLSVMDPATAQYYMSRRTGASYGGAPWGPPLAPPGLPPPPGFYYAGPVRDMRAPPGF